MEPSRADSLLFALKDELTALGRAKRADDTASADHAGARATRSAKARARRVKPVRVFPVGRLDKESSGLVLLTDDGRVSEALLDPRRKAPKTYDVDVHPPASLADAETLARGVVIETTQPIKCRGIRIRLEGKSAGHWHTGGGDDRKDQCPTRLRSLV